MRVHMGCGHFFVFMLDRVKNVSLTGDLITLVLVATDPVTCYLSSPMPPPTVYIMRGCRSARLLPGYLDV